MGGSLIWIILIGILVFSVAIFMIALLMNRDRFPKLKGIRLGGVRPSWIWAGLIALAVVWVGVNGIPTIPTSSAVEARVPKKPTHVRLTRSNPSSGVITLAEGESTARYSANNGTYIGAPVHSGCAMVEIINGSQGFRHCAGDPTPDLVALGVLGKNEGIGSFRLTAVDGPAVVEIYSRW